MIKRPAYLLIFLFSLANSAAAPPLTAQEKIVGEGVGIVEAQRGTLTHHYWTDDRGVVTRVNLIVGTTNNYAPITMSIKKAAESFIKKGVVVSEGILNRVEMAFRAYDPCFGCATHSLPGQMPLQVTIRDARGNVVEVLKQFCD
jgi:F420-non-reducing hydrogenase large subunit